MKCKLFGHDILFPVGLHYTATRDTAVAVNC